MTNKTDRSPLARPPLDNLLARYLDAPDVARLKMVSKAFAKMDSVRDSRAGISATRSISFLNKDPGSDIKWAGFVGTKHQPFVMTVEGSDSRLTHKCFYSWMPGKNGMLWKKYSFSIEGKLTTELPVCFTFQKGQYGSDPLSEWVIPIGDSLFTFVPQRTKEKRSLLAPLWDGKRVCEANISWRVLEVATNPNATKAAAERSAMSWIIAASLTQEKDQFADVLRAVLRAPPTQLTLKIWPEKIPYQFSRHGGDWTINFVTRGGDLFKWTEPVSFTTTRYDEGKPKPTLDLFAEHKAFLQRTRKCRPKWAFTKIGSRHALVGHSTNQAYLSQGQYRHFLSFHYLETKPPGAPEVYPLGGVPLGPRKSPQTTIFEHDGTDYFVTANQERSEEKLTITCRLNKLRQPNTNQIEDRQAHITHPLWQNAQLLANHVEAVKINGTPRIQVPLKVANEIAIMRISLFGPIGGPLKIQLFNHYNDYRGPKGRFTWQGKHYVVRATAKQDDLRLTVRRCAGSGIEHLPLFGPYARVLKEMKAVQIGNRVQVISWQGNKLALFDLTLG